jgi:radical SAM superfamily enzyme YgiQ (UPF0313 family)
MKRVKSILNGFIENKIIVSWDASARVDLVLKLEKEMFELMKRAKCKRIRLGVESGSDRILGMYRKQINKEMIRKAFHVLAENKIPVNASYIIGPPTETKEDFWETVESMKQCLTSGERNVVRMFKYTPIPGTELYELFERKDDRSKDDLAYWYDSYKDITMNIINSPYLYKNDEVNRPPILFYFHLVFRSPVRKKAGSKGIVSLLLKLIFLLAKYRMDHKVFFFPFEWYLFKRYKLWSGSRIH